MITNLNELRKELAETIERIKKDPRFVPQAVEINNAAGKMIGSAKVQIEYMRMTKNTKAVSFMEEPAK